MDDGLISAVAGQIKRIVTIEENVLAGGFGSRMLESLSKSEIAGVHAHCIGIPDEFVTHGTQAILRAKYGLDRDGVVGQILTLFPELIRSKIRS
jgi:1-deoxy-D-xylulose-5-phosphate synthase